MTAPGRPRLGFLGVGWIGRHRLEAVARSDLADIVGVADPSPAMVAQAAALVPGARALATLDDLLALELDGLAIATPSALHAGQAVQALDRGVAVFCQKPLGRTAAEAASVVDAARRADRLLAVDLSYRFTAGIGRIREAVRSGGLGRVFAVDLVFHNAYGPDKPWFYDRSLSGGGCVIDLGVHLVDLALWTLDFPEVVGISSRLLADGLPLVAGDGRVEDYAVATVTLASGAVVQVACSWRLPAGCDAIIAASFYGTAGGAALRNVRGSFYDFQAERFHGTATELLSAPPDDWGGRAAVDWATRLAGGATFDPAADRLIDVARVLDGIYRFP